MGNLEKILMLGVGGAIIYFLVTRPQQTVSVGRPGVYQAPEEPSIISVPTPYPTYPPETLPPEESAPEDPYTPSEGPDFYTSYTIGETWMLNYFQNIDPGPSDTMTCSMEFVTYDTLRSPYSWSFTFDYICIHESGGTGTYRRTVNVIAGTPSIGY